MTMGQEPTSITMPDGLIDLAAELEETWPATLAALHASGTPVCLYDDLTDEQLRDRAVALGIEVADDADRDTIAAAIQAKEKKATPPWGDDANFDAARAWKLIEGLRSDNAKLKTERDQALAKVKEHEDAAKSKEDLAAERAAEAEKNARTALTDAARLRVALKKGLTETQAKRLVGETEEELEADADELLATFTPDSDDGQDPPRRPRERLRPGAVRSSEPEETNPEKLADSVPRMY